MHPPEERVGAGLGIAVETDEAVELLGPDRLPGHQVALPAPQAGDLLGLGELVLTLGHAFQE